MTLQDREVPLRLLVEQMPAIDASPALGCVCQEESVSSREAWRCVGRAGLAVFPREPFFSARRSMLQRLTGDGQRA